MEQELKTLASSLGATLTAQGFKSVAAIDFKDLQGRPTELGRFLSDQLTVLLVSTTPVSMVDRTNIKSILAEHQLTEEGLVRPENARKLGEFAGVDAILNGVVTQLDSVIVLTVQATSTSSARIVAAGKAAFATTRDIQQLLSRSISTASMPVTSPSSAQVPDREPLSRAGGPLASRDIGPLRVVLSSVRLTRARDRRGRFRDALRVSVEFVNLETQKTVVIALNARAPRSGSSGNSMNDTLRSSIADDRGATWHLLAPGTAGVGVVGVGYQGSGYAGVYSPLEIVSLLRSLDASGSGVRGEGMFDYHYVFGSTTTVEPGQATTATMLFLPLDDDAVAEGSTPVSVQIDLELVIGTTGADSKRSYSIRNLTFERVAISRN